MSCRAMQHCAAVGLAIAAPWPRCRGQIALGWELRVLLQLDEQWAASHLRGAVQLERAMRLIR